MASGGTDSYNSVAELPDVVSRAIELARKLDFPLSCRPEQGLLLRLLAGGRRGGVIGETGTGCGVGLSWMLSAVTAETQLFSVEADGERAAACQQLFANQANVVVQHADWSDLLEHAPFDLLVLDGGGAGKKGETPINIATALKVGGTVVIDDFTPMDRWPPVHLGEPDAARLHWLEHPQLRSTEVRLASDLATVVAMRIS